jgi:hypothetical protein
MIKANFCAFMILSASLVFAGGGDKLNAKLRLVDAETGLVLIGAEVTVEADGLVLYSDPDGLIEFDYLAGTVPNLMISYISYRDLSIELAADSEDVIALSPR